MATRSYKTFFGLHLYLVRKYCENPKAPGAQLNVNPARAITWLVGVTIYCTFSVAIHLHLASFFATKYLCKKLATVTGMLNEQIFQLRGPGPSGRICTPITGCFHDKTIICEENFQADCFLLLKYCRKQHALLLKYCRKQHALILLYFLGSNHLQNLTPKCNI